MAESNEISNEENVLSENDALDINELASLNEDISDDFIEQLQNKISQDANIKNDGELFEEVSGSDEDRQVGFNDDIDDNFIKKYKAKLKKSQEVPAEDKDSKPKSKPEQEEPEEDLDLERKSRSNPKVNESEQEEIAAAPVVSSEQTDNLVQIAEVPQDDIATPAPEVPETPENKDSIEAITGGNITEKPLTKDMAAYNESLDYLDGNVNYSKYVIYIDPENKNFIDSLTVKERKNLINKIIREQDSISVTRRRFGNMQSIVMHAIIMILTITISIPCIYWVINASLEATINNYRASQTVFSQLYKPHGKIKTTR